MTPKINTVCSRNAWQSCSWKQLLGLSLPRALLNPKATAYTSRSGHHLQCCCDNAGWSLAGPEALLQDILRLQASSWAAAPQQQHQSAQTSADGPATVLLSAATTLAHMLEAHLFPQDKPKTQHNSQRGHAMDTARQLGTLLSLIGYIGSLSCPVSNYNSAQSPNASASMADADIQQTPGGTAPSEGQGQAESPGVSQHVLPSEHLEGLASNPESQATPDLQSARQCQEICLQASLISAVAQ